jgi:phenolic acid decarboxylase
MALDGFDVRSNKAGLRLEVVTMEGTGAAAPTKLYGPGMTITRTSEGLYKITWTDNPGTFLGMTYSLGAATPSAVSGHTVTYDDYVASTKSIEVLFAEQDFSIFDLADNEYATLVFLFATTAV